MHRVLVGNFLSKQPLGSWRNNIRVVLKKVGCDDGRWMEQTHDCVQWWAVVLMMLRLQVLLLQH
jgi:hypothetical protein